MTSALNIQQRFCTEGSHESVLSERAIQSISNVLATKLVGRGRNWPLFVGASCFAYNTTPHALLGDYSPYELLYGRKPTDPLDLETSIVHDPVNPDIKDFVTSLKERLAEVGQTATELHNKHQQSQAVNRA